MVNGAINPLDGRYYEKTRELAPYFSEEALMKHRILVECEYFIFLAHSKTTGLRKTSSEEEKFLRSLYESWNEASYARIKEFEATTNHDVKAVEYFIKERLKDSSLSDVLEWIHFGLTSEDINNCAYALMLSLSLKNVLIPKVQVIQNFLKSFANDNKNVAMLARTHGQSASPTTLGKEFNVFAHRLERQLKQLSNYKILAKLNGATGNYNALVAAYKTADWIEFSEKFIQHLAKITGANLEVNLITTQIESHDTYAELSDNIRRINMILLDMSQDIWRYVSDGYLKQRPKAGEVGSSTMPHKVNPIDFENAEGNLGLGNALLHFFSTKLPVSRLQRDLSDSTVERSFGAAFGYSFLAYVSIEKGLGKISVNEERIREDLSLHPEVIAEAIQTILRRENYPIPYEALKELTRGKNVDMMDFAKFIEGLKVDEKIKFELRKITPASYTGLAEDLAVL